MVWGLGNGFMTGVWEGSIPSNAGAIACDYSLGRNIFVRIPLRRLRGDEDMMAVLGKSFRFGNVYEMLHHDHRDVVYHGVLRW